MDHLSRASCKVTPSVCHSSLPLKAELEVLNKAAFCRWQRLHMMYITFREPQRLYNIQDVPGTVIHHRIKVRKLRRNPPWWQGSQTLYYAKRYGKRSQHSVSPGIIRTAPESSSSVLPTSNRMISPLQTPHLLLTEPSLTRGRHIPYLMATVLILSAEKLRKSCFLISGTVCNCQTSTGNPVSRGLGSTAPQPKSTWKRQGSCSWPLPSRDPKQSCTPAEFHGNCGSMQVPSPPW